MNNEMAPVTQLTDEKSQTNQGWIDGPIWIERGKKYAISSMDDNHLLAARDTCLQWLGNHARSKEKHTREARDLLLRVKTADSSLPTFQADQIALKREMFKEADKALERHRKIGKIRNVLFDLDEELDKRRIVAHSDLVTIMKMYEEWQVQEKALASNG